MGEAALRLDLMITHGLLDLPWACGQPKNIQRTAK